MEDPLLMIADVSTALNSPIVERAEAQAGHDRPGHPKPALAPWAPDFLPRLGSSLVFIYRFPRAAKTGFAPRAFDATPRKKRAALIKSRP